jgi:hypothetical protein
MNKLEDIVNFIEKSQNIKLMNYQKIMLQAIVEGKTFSSPRMCGRKMILEYYYNYLKSIHGEHRSYNEAEVHITGNDVIKEARPQIIIDEETFKQEYECKWTKEDENKFLKII